MGKVFKNEGLIFLSLWALIDKQEREKLEH
jgi:hypothetical protein